MLYAVSLVEQWRRIEERLPNDWAEARLLLIAPDVETARQALARLGPLAPGRSGRDLRFTAARSGIGGPSAEAVRRALGRLDEEGIGGRLELVSTIEAKPARAAPSAPAPPGLVEQWERALARLPDDWSDLHCQLELTSSDHLEPAALLTAPLNPVRYAPTPGFRFRVARRFGYGASPQMVVRCLERLDAARIGGRVEVLRALCDTYPVATQGPVWYVGGKVV